MQILQRTNMLRLASGLIAISGVWDSEAFDTSLLSGYMSVQWHLTGDGTAKLEILSSNDGTNFLDVNTDIAAAQTKITGPGSDGKNMASVSFIPSFQAKIRITETGAANTITNVNLFVKGY